MNGLYKYIIAILLIAQAYVFAEARNRNRYTVYLSKYETVAYHHIDSVGLFIFKDSLVNEPYRMVFLCTHESDSLGQLKTMPEQIDGFRGWLLLVYKVVGGKFERIANYSKKVEECKIHTKYFETDKQSVELTDKVIQGQISNINFFLKKYGMELRGYLIDVFEAHGEAIGAKVWVPNSNHIYETVLLNYIVVPATYDKDYIYWDDIIDKRTWENCK